MNMEINNDFTNQDIANLEYSAEVIQSIEEAEYEYDIEMEYVMPNSRQVSLMIIDDGLT
jgi:hypothetical protein